MQPAANVSRCLMLISFGGLQSGRINVSAISDRWNIPEWIAAATGLI